MAAIAALAAASSASASKPAQVRAQAKEALKTARCDKCHDSSVAAENPGALAVYDLVEEAWPARMKDAQLPKLLKRLKSAPAADREIVRKLVALELKLRAAAGK
jgi:hypothetical protein